MRQRSDEVVSVISEIYENQQAVGERVFGIYFGDQSLQLSNNNARKMLKVQANNNKKDNNKKSR